MDLAVTLAVARQAVDEHAQRDGVTTLLAHYWQARHAGQPEPYPNADDEASFLGDRLRHEYEPHE